MLPVELVPVPFYCLIATGITRVFLHGSLEPSCQRSDSPSVTALFVKPGATDVFSERF